MAPRAVRRTVEEVLMQRLFRSLLRALALTALTLLPPLQATEPVTDLSEGGPTFRSGDNSLTLGAYVQVRFTAEDREGFDGDAPGAAGFGAEDGWGASFDVAKVRLSLKGTMYRAWLRYNVAYELSRTSGESDNKIKDAYLEVAHHRAAVVRAGQYKLPFGMQELVADTDLHFVERSIATSRFAPSRDTGVQVSGTFRDRRLGYAAGVFNGSGESRRQEDDSLLWAGRVWWDPFGELKLSEAALGGDPEPRLHLGLAVRSGEAIRGGTPGVATSPDDQRALGLEAAWKQGPWFAAGEWFRQTDERRNPLEGPDVRSRGWYLQAGWLVVPERFELALRLSGIDPDRSAAGDRVGEARLALNLYLQGHRLKLSTDLGRVRYEPLAPGRGERLPGFTGGDVDDRQVRMQAQLAF
jgi:phosphate-selective porin